MKQYVCLCSSCEGRSTNANHVAVHTYKERFPLQSLTGSRSLFSTGTMNCCPFCGEQWGDLSRTTGEEDRLIVGQHLDGCPKYKLAIVAGRLP